MLIDNEVMRNLLDANTLSAERAVEMAIRTGTPLVFSKNGKIKKVKPKYKYVLVSTEKAKKIKPVTLKQITRELMQGNVS